MVPGRESICIYLAHPRYSDGSLAANIATSTIGYLAGIYEAPLEAALCWFIWAILLGGKTADELELTLELNHWSKVCLAAGDAGCCLDSYDGAVGTVSSG